MGTNIIDKAVGTQALSEARLFRGLNGRALEEATALALPVEKGPEEIFFRQGEKATRLCPRFLDPFLASRDREASLLNLSGGVECSMHSD